MKTTTALILILISVGLFYSFTSSQYQKLGELSQSYQSYSDILDNVSDLTTKRDEISAEYRNIPQINKDNLSKVLPDNVDIVRLSMDFDSIASQYGISIKSIQETKNNNDNSISIIMNPASKSYDSSTISFDFVASYDNFRKFMHDIESSLRIINIKSIDFQSADNNLYQFRVSLETYWLK